MALMSLKSPVVVIPQSPVSEKCFLVLADFGSTIMKNTFHVITKSPTNPPPIIDLITIKQVKCDYTSFSQVYLWMQSFSNFFSIKGFGILSFLFRIEFNFIIIILNFVGCFFFPFLKYFLVKSIIVF